MNKNYRLWITTFAWVWLPLRGTSGPVQAEPLVAINATPAVTTARELLANSSVKAAPLQVRPRMWEWLDPLTISQGQPAPLQNPQPAATTPEDTGEDPFLDEVSVTATRRPSRERDTTATTYSVRKEDFKAVAAQTATDALQLVPGFVGNPALGGVRNQQFYFLRGFNDQRFLVLRDGLSLSSSQNGRATVSQVTLDDLERIEVVTGGATLRYGPGSVGGVVNLITETPKGPPKLTLESQTGSYGFSKYLAKYGGGDDTFSYNFIYSGLVAFNNYPFKFTVNETAQFYGPSTNPQSRPPADAVKAENINPSFYPNGVNSFGYGSPAEDPGRYADPDNSGGVNLFGFLKPQVGPPTVVNGTADASYTAQDSYTAKLVFKPNPSNRLALRLGQRNSNFNAQGPGENYFSACTTGSTGAPNGNGTTFGERFFPLDADGNELPCNPARYVIGTASTQLQRGLPSNFNTSRNGSLVFPTGRPYGVSEGALADIQTFQQRNVSSTEISFNWDHELSPTASVNSYAYFLRQTFTRPHIPSPYTFNTNLRGIVPTEAFDRRFFSASTSFVDGNKYELQTALNWQLSPGQILSFGINFVEDRVLEQRNRGRQFVDLATARTSIFLVDDLNFSSEWKANLGLRWTSSSQFGEVLTPAVGVRYTPANWLSLRANWSQVFNAPSFGQLFSATGRTLGNPNLLPESGVTYDVGVDINPVRNLGLRLTYFSTYLNNTITELQFVNPGVNNPNSSGFGIPTLLQSRNIASQLGTGIEAELNWQISEQLRARVAWTNTDSRPFGLVDSIENGNFFYQYQTPGIPFNNVATTLTYAHQGWLASLLLRYDSGKRRPDSSTYLGAWATLDLNVEVPLTRAFTLTGSVFNLTDTQYEYYGGNPAPGTTFRVGGRFELGG